MASKRKAPLTQTTDSYTREFKRIFEKMPSHQHRHKLFDDWLAVAACCAHQEPYHLGLLPKDEPFNQVEAEYMQAIRGYTREQLCTFAELYALTKLALYHAKSDFLGSIFMELELGNSHTGQFFTPYSLSLLIARMTLTGIEQIIKEKGFFTVQEPASGGGSMLIAVAQCVEEMGYDPGEVLFFEAVDISQAAFNMTYLQTSLIGLNGRVIHGNSLSRDTWEVRFTPISRIFWWRTAHMLRSTYQAQAEPLRPQMETRQAPAQTTLFDLELPTGLSAKRPQGRRELQRPSKQIEIAQPTLFKPFERITPMPTPLPPLTNPTLIVNETYSYGGPSGPHWSGTQACCQLQIWRDDQGKHVVMFTAPKGTCPTIRA